MKTRIEAGMSRKQKSPTIPRFAKGRELSGLSAAQAAKLLDITEARLGSFERGKSKPAPMMLRDMANVYGVSLPWLEGSPPVSSKQTAELLKYSDLSFSDRDKIEEVIGSLPMIEEK